MALDYLDLRGRLTFRDVATDKAAHDAAIASDFRFAFNLTEPDGTVESRVHALRRAALLLPPLWPLFLALRFIALAGSRK